MSILYTGFKGTELVNFLDKDYPVIEVRCKYILDGEPVDILMGYCSYVNGELTSLDDDEYSYSMKVIEAKEFIDEDGQTRLVVWEQGETR